MEGFEEKLHFYFPEQPPDEATAEYLPERHVPLPEWAKFFLRIGLKLAEKRADNNDLESLVISTPCRDLAASLICFGIMKGYSDSIENAELKTHFIELKSLPEWTPLYYREKKGMIPVPALFVRFDPDFDAIVVRTQSDSPNSKNPTETLHYVQELKCNSLQLAGEEVILPKTTGKKGKQIVSHPAFLDAVLEKTTSDVYTSNLQLQTIILGSKNLLVEEMIKEDFSFGREYVTGSLDDLIKLRSVKLKGSNYGAFIIPRDGDGSDRFSQSPDLRGTPFVIFDSPKSFLYWRRSWSESNWIVLLSRTESTYQDAVINVNEQVARNEQSRLMDEIERLEIPPGIELICFSRKRWN